MKHFRRLQENIDTAAMLAEISVNASAFEAHRGRQEKVKVQREALAIPLRGLRASAIGERQRRDVHESRWTSGSQGYPQACAFLKTAASALEGELSRAKIVCLPPGHRVYPHIDRGEYYRHRNRYHLVIKSSGSWMRAADEEVRMRTGELWWFDNDQLHEARNDGDDDRIHLIFDLLPRGRLAALTAGGAGLVRPAPDAKVR